MQGGSFYWRCENMKVFINPGHAPDGSPDPGACGYGLRESDVAASIGNLVCHYLNAVGIETESIQSDSLGEITAAANKSGAGLFISIHCNAFNGAAHGTETCVYSENGEGARLGGYVQAQIVHALGTADRGLKERTNLYVLKHTSMPAILVETAFIDEETDNALLRDRQDDFARAIARGVTDYMSGGFTGADEAATAYETAGDHSKYFSRAELSCHCCGGLPDGGMEPRLLSVLDAMRERIGKPCFISCAYRCPAHNAEVGGVSNSQHVLGTAADFQLPDGWSVEELAQLAEECGADGIGCYSWGCHVDVRGYAARWDER